MQDLLDFHHRPWHESRSRGVTSFFLLPGVGAGPGPEVTSHSLTRAFRLAIAKPTVPAIHDHRWPEPIQT